MNDVPAKRVLTFEEMKDTPGAFLWHGDEPPSRLTFCCPCGCGAFGGASVSGDSTKEPIWQWDGDLEHPTLTPSIRFLSGCGWHGYLTDGVFRTCA